MRYILALLFLCLPSLAFGQNFITAVDSSAYPDVVVGNKIPLNSEYAVLKWTYTPANTTPGVPFHVLSADIIPSFTIASGFSKSVYGYSHIDNENDIRTFYSVITSDTIYTPSIELPSIFNNGILNQLRLKNLGTVQQRAAYIAGFKAKPPQIVSPGDILGTFTKMLGPWAYALVGMMIALLGLDIGSSKMKKVAGEAAKLERSARRTEINRQIKNDQTARVYQRKLRNMSHFLYTYTDRDDFYKDVRKRFKQTSIDYAEYKASKGWIL